MELYFHYFLLIKLSIMGILGFCIYKFYTSLATLRRQKKELKFVTPWSITTATLLLFLILSPVKMDLGTNKTTSYANNQIEQSKELPPKVEDNSFTNRVDAVKSLTQEQLN